MKAYHIKKIKHTGGAQAAARGRRAVSLLLCLCMVLSVLSQFGGMVLPTTAAAEQTISALNRIADGDTTDTYDGKLLSDEWGSRYAGRVWTDKSVFAYGTPIELDMATDGYDDDVSFNADFGTVFSALASSQVVNEASPIDVMFVLDISGSMGKLSGGLATAEDFDTTPAWQLVDAINTTIDKLLSLSPESRFGIVVYGATAAVLVPLGYYDRYEKDEGMEYLQAEYMEQYSTQGVHFKLTATVRDMETKSVYTYCADNAGPTSNETHDTKGGGNRNYKGTGGQTAGTGSAEDPYEVGHITNPQAGFAAAMDQFITGNSELVWTSSSGKECLRLPAMIHLTDGQASDLAWIQTEGEPDSPNAWMQTTNNWNNVDWNFDLAYNSTNDYDPTNNNYYNASQLTGHGDAAPVIFQTLMTAAYYKTAVDAYYASTGMKDIGGNDASLTCFSVYASDADPYGSLTNPLIKATIDAILDPQKSFQDLEGYGSCQSAPLQKEEEEHPGTVTTERYIDTAYELFKAWRDIGEVGVTFTEKTTSSSSEVNDISIPINAVKSVADGAYAGEAWSNRITIENVSKNIYYVASENFIHTEFSGLTAVFDNIIQKMLGNIFSPLGGDNQLGVASSITYQDPLGEYMELKNGAINVTTHLGYAADYDMALLLFGEMHGINRTGVYDFHWNDAWIGKNLGEGKQGTAAMVEGWYLGDDPNEAISGGKFSVPHAENGTGDALFDTPTAARAAGWIYRFNFQTAIEFIPTLSDVKTPAEIPEQMKNTVYTIYQFAASGGDEASQPRRNPIYGDVPQNVKNDWDKAETDKTELKRKPPGLYELSDIRIWAEHTGDYVDSDGSISPQDQGGYDDALYVNVPVAAVPTQLAEITVSGDGPRSYETNLGDDHEGDSQNAYYAQSTPIRLFYAVGLTEDLIQRDSDGNQTGVDVSKISGEYIASHSDPTTGNIYFISNWYSNTAYRGYTSDEAEASRTRGDAVVTFSPNVANRYYLFQKPLPLIAHAYRVQNDAGDVAPVDNDGSKAWGANGSGNGGSIWEDGQVGGATWSGGEFIGTYENEEAFKAALQAKTKGDDDVFYIEDAKGYSYPLPPDITNAIITYTKDQLSNVDSDGDGYADNANSFSSNDYFFLCVEYYMPMAGYGKDIHNREDTSTRAVCKVYRMIARKGSAFGSGLQSEHIGNGDMLCWHDIKGNCTQEIDYNSLTDTGDITRGRPTLEKLTKTGGDLRTYLSEKCGISEGYLDQECAKWTALQGDAHMQSLINQIKGAPDQQAMFDELFDWSVSAKTHGIRVGDMFNNMQAKSGDLVDGYYTGNVTQTANNYYIPTLSEKSTAGDGLIINNYLGNNGRLEVANDNLIVTKTLVAPEGFTLTESQQAEDFQYQVYVQGLTGERSAQRLKWNPFSQSWQRRVETLDILTGNSSLLLDNNGSRALFCFKDGKLQQVVAVIDNETGLATYFYANPDGSAPTEKCDHTDELYCIYLPDHDGDLTYRLFASDYDTGTEVISGVGTTAYYPHGMDTKMLPEADHDSQTFAEEITDKGDGSMDNRPAGSREYWTEEAELIPYAEIMAAEADDGSLDTVGGSGDIALMALMAESDHWSYDETKGYADAPRLPLVTVIPNKDSTESTVYSPFSSRTQYMTVPLYFGYTGELAAHLAEKGETLATCLDLDDYRLTGDFLYDTSVPTTERSDLFNADKKHNADSNRIAQNTAEFTLKAGEGLLLTGLGNRITYRFTEKLTNDQLAQGYSLKEVNHIEEPDSGSLPDSSLHDDTGIYSVFGDTDHASEQTHYTNTVDPELFVLIKKMVSKDGTPVVVAPNQEFTFTLTFTPDPNAAMTDMDDVLHYWKGDKDSWTSNESWTDESSGATYKMPEHAPPLDGYEKYLTDGDTRLKPISPDEGTDRTYTVKLKANEAIVFYGLIAGTTYSVTETADEHYPIVPEEDGYTKSGTINRASVSKDEISPETTHNRADFKNLLQGGILTVEKNILDDNRWALTDDFGFTVVLSAEEGIPLSAERLSVTRFTTKEDGSESSEELPTTAWTTETAAGETRLTATFRLKHGERFVISGIPLGTKYTVKESDRNGYNLEYVVDVIQTPDTSNSENFIHPEDFTTEGDITEKQPQAYWLFVNAKPPVLAFTGGAGVGLFYVLGAVCLLVSGLALVRLYRKRRAE